MLSQSKKQKILQEVEDILKEEEYFLVPIKKVWLYIQEEYDLRLEELAILLSEDGRFRIQNLEENNEESWPSEEVPQMEALGYFFGPSVMLKERMPTKEEMAEILHQKTERITEVLKNAYEARIQEEGSDGKKEKLLEITNIAQKLRKELDKAFKKKRKREKENR
ncbi:MAG: hypothetical protein COY82_01115 [Parcubacteria group bacterium CG_4_10_14_0_8_um_filter_35_7]|nr:MAG: hypothetical protein COX43_02505 [Parcubacteria group bacterium CG23_combo_of_CG06-09_8_20_14_all_35_9]PIY78692.1 MAG: hypothetical protein COY82_01115 [Parcubacteria group bacterium CG_4_10_14_0_8_um_filter_35_7]